MTRAKKQLLAKAPWRGEENNEEDELRGAKLRVANEPGSIPTMHVPAKKHIRDGDERSDGDLFEIYPELRYSFHRNLQFLRRVFTIDTFVKPLPPSMAYNFSRNLNFFMRIFTQFFGMFLWLIYVRSCCKTISHTLYAPNMCYELIRCQFDHPKSRNLCFCTDEDGGIWNNFRKLSTPLMGVEVADTSSTFFDRLELENWSCPCFSNKCS